MPVVTPEIVKQVALLARLRLEGDTLAQTASQLDQILGYVQRLQQVATDQVEPTTHVLPLSNVLPDIYNLGYQDTRLLVLDSVNGRRISRLADLEKAFTESKDGFHSIEYMHGDSLRRMVLDATTAARATRRVMETYRIEEDRLIHGEKKEK